MIRLSASLSRKLPVAGIEFSSQSVSAGLEVEVSDSADGEEIARKLKSIYTLLDRSITEQIGAASKAPSFAAFESKSPSLDPANETPKSKGGNGNGSPRRGNGQASPAQIKAVFAISKNKGMDRKGLVELLKAEYGVERPDDLSVKDASDLIGKLQNMEGPRS
jgi:hypothetical protein